MIDLFRKLYGFLAPQARTRLAFILAAMFAVAFLDMLSVGMIIPLVEVIAGGSKSIVLANIKVFLPPLGDQQLVTIIALSFAALFALKNSALCGLMYVINKFIYFALAAFQQKMFYLYLCRPYSFHLHRNSSRIVRDLIQSTGMAFNGFRHALTITLDGILVCAIIALLVYVNPLITLVLGFIFIVITVLFYIVVSPLLRRWGHEMLNLEGRHLKSINEGLGAIKDVKLTHSENMFLSNYTALTNSMARVVSRTITFSIAPRLFIETVIMLLFLAATLVLVSTQESLTQVAATVGLFAMAALRLMPSANRILTSATELQQRTAPIQALYDDMIEGQTEAETSHSAADSDKVSFADSISIRNLSFKYPQADHVALEDINLTIKKGDIIGIVGQSGAGKTTLIDILLGFLTPTEGRFFVDDVDVVRYRSSWQNRLGFVPQDIYILDKSILRNIAIGRDTNDIDNFMLNYAIDSSNLRPVIDRLPDGIETRLGERGIRFSGGQRQRIGIARALYRNPDVLVFDEATSSLDNESEREINLAIENLIGNKTIIIIAHRISSVRICNRIVFMKNGRIDDIGTFDDLISRNQDFRLLATLGQTQVADPSSPLDEQDQS